MIATDLTRIPTQRADRDWLILVTDDNANGFTFTATRCGLLWASGWVRTRSESSAMTHARQVGAAAYCAELLCPTQETP